MRFTPLTEQEIYTSLLLPEGSYNFEVITAKEKISKSGREMIELQLKLWGIDGKEHVIFDYLLEAMKFKLIHFCEATGLKEKYGNGNLNATDCEYKTGKVEIIIQSGQTKPDGSKYQDKNSVKDYLIIEKKVESSTEEFKDDLDLPF